MFDSGLRMAAGDAEHRERLLQFHDSITCCHRRLTRPPQTSVKRRADSSRDKLVESEVGRARGAGMPAPCGSLGLLVEWRLEVSQGDQPRYVADRSGYRRYRPGCAAAGPPVPGELQLLQ